ncbi:uncharacterized protein LOC131684732 isoform X2 [Topomyia yanbarensis]|nr:uncharacterized protein LOC131684732 isoform X2 [Topomyia yanbarensis]XP_058823834.1 uncharacterized protein LOC131684732 isoform X2 [Topomyia yanbarensis]XP_058823835.1 uncharacterized protein LOC131684732 isoform X2 [Topomyia yanbarensis]
MKTEISDDHGSSQLPIEGVVSGMDVDDDDYIEEEMILFADFAKYLTEEELTDTNLRIKVIGIETDAPIIQINNDVYEGSYDFAMGTNVFLEEDAKTKSLIDPLYSPDPEKVYKYAGQSTKVLKMQRIFITPKAADITNVKTESEAVESETDNTKNRYLVTRTYEEALNLHLPRGMNPPRHIEPEQNCEQVVQSRSTFAAGMDSDGHDDPLDPDYDPDMES